METQKKRKFYAMIDLKFVFSLWRIDSIREPLFEPNGLCTLYFCRKNCIGTQGEDLSPVKVL